MALTYRPFDRASVTTKLPPEIRVVGEFKEKQGGWQGTYRLNDESLQEYLRRLREIIVDHTVRGELQKNGGLGGAPYELGDVPRATLSDPQGELEVLLEAYTVGMGPAAITVYSTEPERAREVLSQHFAANEFGPH